MDTMNEEIFDGDSFFEDSAFIQDFLMEEEKIQQKNEGERKTFFDLQLPQAIINSYQDLGVTSLFDWQREAIFETKV